MSHPSQAVFLSYASQDAAAAKRIADALRAAGVEVWFDQDELVGGDAWDAKIRRQIGSCALFVPIISANTQARTEGYFRLEWRLADQRTHLMGRSKTFLLPVAIDGTRDAEADVPDSFLTVQWTRLPGGETTPAFVSRAQKLLNAGPAAIAAPAAQSASARSGVGRARRPWLVPVALVTLLGSALAVWHPWRNERAPATAAPPVATPLSDARKLAQQAMQLLEDPNSGRDAMWLADELSQRALTLDSGDAEVWAVASFASHYLFLYNHDRSMSRWEKARAQAARASQLDPQSVNAALAVVCSQMGNDNDEERRQVKRELHRRVPGDPHILYALLLTEALQNDEAAIQQLMAEMRALPRTGWQARALWAEVIRLQRLARLSEAETIVEEMFAWSGDLRSAYYEKLRLLTRSWHDLAEAEHYIPTIPARYRQEPAFAAAIAQYWLWRGKPDQALEALVLVVQDYLEEYDALLPKGYLTGWAHALAGRTVAAQAEWRKALGVIDERLKADGRRMTLLNQRALLLALTNQGPEARAAWQLRIELGGTNQAPRGGVTEAELFAALGEPERTIAAIERGWAESSVAERISRLPALRWHPAFAAIRDDARVQRILNEGLELLAKLRAERARAPRAPESPSPASSPAPDAKSIAVLAFANLSDDKANEYFSDGISEELLNVLAKVPGLKVSARTSAFFFKGKEVPVPEIARQLGVAYVVEGSVRKQGNQVRITAQLIKAADGFHVWSDTFTRDLRDIFAVQDEIARLIAQNLSLKIGAPASAGAGPAAVNPEAYRLYLEAREAWNQRNAAGLRLAEQLLYRALELEPGFARAHAALADVWTVRSFPLAGSYSQHDSPILAKTIARAEQAVALDGNSAEAYAALGHALDRAWRFDEALRALQRATELNPNYASAHQWLGRALLVQGRMDEALASLQRAAELDPLSHRILDNYSDSLVHVGRLEEAWSMLQRAAALHPTGVQIRCKQALLLIRLGRRDEALAAARALAADTAAEDPDYRLSVAAAILWTFGERAEADTLLNRIAVDSEDRPIALAYCGRLEEFLRHLDEVTVNWCDHLWFDPALESVRTHPAFRAWVERVGLTEEFARAKTWKAAHLAPKREEKP